MSNIGKSISSVNTNSELIEQWNNIVYDLISNHITNEIEISPVLAEKYKGDLYGLFTRELNITPELVHPYVRVNGYDSSDCYDGNKLTFSLLDNTVLNMYYRMFIRTKK